MATLEVRPENEERIVYLSGELDMACERVVNEWLSRVDVDSGTIVLDLSAVSFMDSTGIRCILRVAQAVQVVLRGAQPNVRRVLSIVGLDRARGITIED